MPELATRGYKSLYAPGPVQLTWRGGVSAQVFSCAAGIVSSVFHLPPYSFVTYKQEKFFLLLEFSSFFLFFSCFLNIKVFSPELSSFLNIKKLFLS